MRKFVLMVVVMAIAAPAMADMVFTAADIGSGQVLISYVSTVAPRGVGLLATLTGDLVLESVVSVHTKFNTNMDHAYDNAGTYAIGDGNPIADPAGPGNLAMPTAGPFSISVGVLDQGGGQVAGDMSGDLITLQLSGTAGTITIEADTLRSATGAVGSDIPTNFAAATGVAVVIPPSGCFPTDHPDYSQWLLVGTYLGMNGVDEGPECWCGDETSPDVWESYQCYGDSTGLPKEGSPFTGYYSVGGNDLITLVAAWAVVNAEVDQVDSNGVPFVCADFEHTQEGSPFTGYYRVGGNDLIVLVAGWANTGFTPDCLDVP